MRIGNWYLLELVLEHIIKNPADYNQTSWSCGSQRCIAGWIADMAGYQFISSGTVVPNYVKLTIEDDGDISNDVWDLSAEVETVALKMLEIDPETDTDDVANMLFLGTLSWPEVLTGVYVLAQADERFLSETIMDEMRRVGVVAEV